LKLRFVANPFLKESFLLFVLYLSITIISLTQIKLISVLVFIYIFSFIPYFKVVLKAQRLGSLEFGPIFFGAILFRLVLVPSLPIFSDDIYRYLWDGKVTLAGINPYLYPPCAEELSDLRDHIYIHINHRDVSTFYPPLAQFFFVLGAIFYSIPFTKIMLIGFDLGIISLIYFLGGRGLKGARASLIYGWNPLPIIEFASSGHIDSLAIFFLLVAIFFIDTKRVFSAFMFGCSIGAKLVSGAILPLFVLRFRVRAIVSILVVIFSYICFSSAGWGVFRGMDACIRRWQANDGLFYLVYYSASKILELEEDEAERDGKWNLSFLYGLVTKLKGSFFDLRKEQDPLGHITVFQRRDLALGIAKCFYFAVVFLMVIFLVLKKYAPILGAPLILGTVILAGPIVHPWYIIWLLPFGAMFENRSLILLSGLVVLHYLGLEGWIEDKRWIEYGFIKCLEYIPFFFFLFFDYLREKKIWV
jgi:hypothetical protein